MEVFLQSPIRTAPQIFPALNWNRAFLFRKFGGEDTEGGGKKEDQSTITTSVQLSLSHFSHLCLFVKRILKRIF